MEPVNVWIPFIMMLLMIVNPVILLVLIVPREVFVRVVLVISKSLALVYVKKGIMMMGSAMIVKNVLISIESKGVLPMGLS